MITRTRSRLATAGVVLAVMWLCCLFSIAVPGLKPDPVVEIGATVLAFLAGMAFGAAMTRREDIDSLPPRRGGG